MKKKVILLLLCTCLITGCGGKKWEDITVKKDSYSMTDYASVTVETGNLTPEFELQISRDGVKRIEYSEFNGELTLEKVYVSLGDKVNKGDILVSFESKEIKKNIDDYLNMISGNNSQIEHLNNLMNINNNNDYAKDIERLKEDNHIYELYMEEEKEKLAAFQIIAEETGTISYVDDNLSKGYFKPGRGIIIETYGSGEYAAVTKQDYPFEIGQKYVANADGIPFELEISAIDINNNKIIFKPISDMSSLTDKDRLIITIKKDEQKNAVYVDSRAITRTEDKAYVYLLDEDGFRHAVFVEVGDVVGDVTIIKAGLKGGEKVTINWEKE